MLAQLNYQVVLRQNCKMEKSLQTVYQQIKEIALKNPSVKTNILCSIEKENQMHITLNRPKQMNSFSQDMYITFAEYLNKANEMDNVKFIVIKGSGGNFTSGNDLNNFANQELNQFDRKVLSGATAKILRDLGDAFILSKKPIFGLIDGRTIGFGFTQIALYDKAFATERSTFMAPLVKIAQGPEMSSSYTFPKIFGQALAEEIIIKGKWMNPKDLQKYGFLSVYKDDTQAEKALQEHIASLEELDWASYIKARQLMRLSQKENLLKANRIECENLIERWSNEDLPAYIIQYMAKRKAQKPKL